MVRKELSQNNFLNFALKAKKALENQGLQRNSLYNHADRRVYHQCEALYIINTKC